MRTEPVPAPASDDTIASGIFFIVGTGRCGSTLLQAMLNAHPRLHVPPETHFFPRLAPRRLIGKNVIPSGAIDRYVNRAIRAPRWEEFGVSAHELRNAIGDGARDSASLLLWLLRRTSPGADACRLGEKTPRHAMYVPEIREAFPRARFIHCVRDPRDVVCSMKSMAWSRGDSAYTSAKRCKWVYDALSVGADAGRVLDVRYEDLVHEPERELRRVCEFLDEPYDRSMLRYDELGTSAYHPREESWKGMTRRPLDRSRINRYRGCLSGHEIRTVEWVVGEHLGRLGYGRDDAYRELTAMQRLALKLRALVPGRPLP